jgi:type 1 glutamine amidotransferase
MTSRSCLLAMLAMVLALPAVAQELNTSAPRDVPCVAPRGRVIIDGAPYARAGVPQTYELAYGACPAMSGMPLQLQVKETWRVERIVKNPKTGQDEKKGFNESETGLFPFVLKTAGRDTIQLPAPRDRTSTLEIGLAATGDKPQLISNTLTLRQGKGGIFQLPEADDIQKMIDAAPVNASVQPAKPRRVLIYTAATGFYHSSIPIGARAVQILGHKTSAYEAVISNDRHMFEPEALGQFDAVMLMNTTGELLAGPDQATTDRLRQSFMSWLRSGRGVAGSHAATDCSYRWKEYGEMIGGYFAGHPFSRIVVKNEHPTSPVNAAFKGEDFEIRDEIYTFRDPYSRRNLRVLLSIDMEKTKLADDPDRPGFKKGENRADHDYALSWIKTHGEGRVFYCAFGHEHQIFWNPMILQHFLDGMQFATGDLKADTTPSAP